MINLIAIELKKLNVSLYVNTSIIMMIGVMIISIILPLFEMMDTGNVEQLFTNFDSAYTLINVINCSMFIVFASVLTSKLLVEEFSSKMIMQLFSYPIDRRKLIWAKCLIVIGWTLLTILLSGAFTSFLFTAANFMFSFVPGWPSTDVIIRQLRNLLFFSFIFSLITLLPFYIGLRTKSIPATILSAVLLIATMNFNPSGMSFAMFAPIPILIAFAGTVLTYLAIRRLNNHDVDC